MVMVMMTAPMAMRRIRRNLCTKQQNPMMTLVLVMVMVVTAIARAETITKVVE
jgi:hypothetical protein